MLMEIYDKIMEPIPVLIGEMNVLPYLLVLLFDGMSIWGLFTSGVYMAGVWRMFKKSGVPAWYAFIPCARDYMFAKCAGREQEGRVSSVMAFLLKLLALFELFADYRSYEHFLLVFDVLELTLGLIHVVYLIRIYAGIVEVYGRRKRWLWLWIPFDWLTAMIWGFSPKFQPSMQVEDFNQAARSVITGKEAETMAEGLTVNLKERTVTEFFQKKVLLYDIHLAIQPGHMVLLLGGSGAGKTTFLNAVNGYEKAKAKVTLDGGDMYRDYKKMMYKVGFVPQQELMRGKDTVYHTLMDAATLRMPAGVYWSDRKKRVEEVMKIFGLTPVQSNLVDKLSGGQKKRLSIAMEFVSNPTLFILDEPDSGLDGVMARELMQQLRQIADQGRIVIVITHTPDRVIDLFDDVIVLAKDSHRTGRLAFFGSIGDARKFFGKDRMEQIVLSINRQEEGGEGRADEFIQKYAEVAQNA